MKPVLCMICLCVFLSVNGQKKKTLELCGTFNSVEPVITSGVMFFADARQSSEGDYKNYSFATGITGKYFIAENIAVRLKTIFTKRDLSFHVAGFQGANSIEDISGKQSLFKLAPGIQWSFTQNKISFFAGLDLPVTIHGKMTELTYISVQTTTPPNPGTNTVNRSFVAPGGTSIGIGMFTGTNFNITKRFAIGFEIGTAIERTSVGGTTVMHQVSTGSYNNETTNYDEATTKQLKFAGLQAGLVISFQLH